MPGHLKQTTMATKRTKTENIKTQVDNLIESAQHTATRGWQGHEREVYTMQGAGTFTAEYEITSGWTREQIEEELRRRARRIDNRRDINTQKLDLRSNRLQRAMAYIGEHREMISFLQYMNETTRGGVRMNDAVEVYCAAHGRPEWIERKWNNLFRTYDYHFAPKGIYEADLVSQAPYLPKAWRCA